MAASFAPNSNTNNQQSTTGTSKENEGPEGPLLSLNGNGNNPETTLLPVPVSERKIPEVTHLEHEQKQSCTCTKEIVKKPETTICQSRQQGNIHEFLQIQIIIKWTHSNFALQAFLEFLVLTKTRRLLKSHEGFVTFWLVNDSR